MRLQEDKSRFINNLPWETEEEKQKVLDFFKIHSNLESKIQNWQSKDKENLVNEIRNLISEVEKASLEKEKAKQGYRGNIDWEAHECRYLGEDEDWIYVTPISYEGAKFCDSAECGGAGAKWCIGWEKSDCHWRIYTEGRRPALFLMKFNKHPEDKQNDLKFMIEWYPGDNYAKIWNQIDKPKRYSLSEKEKEYLIQVKNIREKELEKRAMPYFDNPEPGVYIAKDIKAFKHIQDIKAFLKVFKVKEGLDCSSLTSAHEMFRGCMSLQSVDTSVFTNVVDAYEMFQSCASLQSVDTSVFTNVKDAREMFSFCRSLQSIDTSVFKNVKYADQMFCGCTSLQSIDTSGFVNVKSVHWMFAVCTSLTSIDTSAFVNVESASGMFEKCKSLKSIDTSGFVNVGYASDMFKDCASLTSIDTSAFVNVRTATGMFRGCKSLRSIDTSAFTNAKWAGGMFRGCRSLQSVDMSTFRNVEDARDMFLKCSNIKTYTPSGNHEIDSQLDELGAKPVKRLGESLRRRVIEEILEE